MKQHSHYLINRKIMTTLLGFIVFMLLFSSVITVPQALPDYTVFQREVPQVNQQIKLPDVKVINITTSEEFPEENTPIYTTITVENNDTITYPQIFQLYAVLTELVLSPHQEEKPQPLLILNHTLPSLPSKDTVQVSFTFSASLGQYSLTAYLAYNNTMLPNSDYTTVVSVISAPIGSVNTLLEIIGIIFLVAVLTLLLPAIIDKIRLRNYKKKNSA